MFGHWNRLLREAVIAPSLTELTKNLEAHSVALRHRARIWT